MTTPTRRPNGYSWRARRWLDGQYQLGRCYRSSFRARYRRITQLGED